MKTNQEEWKELENTISEMSTIILSDSDSEQEEETGRIYRPKNVKIALALLPIFKDTCGSVYPLPKVRTFHDGSVRFRWTNPQTLSAVTCSIRIEETDYEVDISKYIVHGETTFNLFSFSVDNQENKEFISKMLAECLKDAFK